jgi:hypothetical protein
LGGGATFDLPDSEPGNCQPIRRFNPLAPEKLKDQVDSLFPRVDFPDAILEIPALTGFVEDRALSICVVLVAEACNISLEPLVRPEIPALTAARLAWVQQNYIHAETLIRATAPSGQGSSRHSLTKARGGGKVATNGRTPFVVPVRTLHAGYNSKYFHVERGVTYYNFTSDQFSGLGDASLGRLRTRGVENELHEPQRLLGENSRNGNSRTLAARSDGEGALQLSQYQPLAYPVHRETSKCPAKPDSALLPSVVSVHSRRGCSGPWCGYSYGGGVPGFPANHRRRSSGPCILTQACISQ